VETRANEEPKFRHHVEPTHISQGKSKCIALNIESTPSVQLRWVVNVPKRGVDCDKDDACGFLLVLVAWNPLDPTSE
jgi:hypothetical protein